MKNLISILLVILLCVLTPSCKKQTYKAYHNIYPPSLKGGTNGKSGPYRLYTQNGLYYIESYPFNNSSYAPDDFCAGFTKVWNAKNNSLLYTINKYFEIDNTFISSDGKSIAYINFRWHDSKDDFCSQYILEFYNNGELKKGYTSKELLKQEIKESSWLFWDAKINLDLWQNNKYTLDDVLYLVPEKTGTVLEMDLKTGNLLNEIDTSDYLNGLELIDYIHPKIDFIPLEEVVLPNLKNGYSFIEELGEELNLKIIDYTDEREQNRYYFNFKINFTINKNGNISDIKVESSEHVLIELSDDLCEKIKSYLEAQLFHIDSLPYDLDFWRYRIDLILSRNPSTKSRKDLDNFLERVCTIDSINGVYIPFDVQDAHKELNKLLTDSDKSKIKEGESVHFGIGMWIRNNWGLWVGGRLKCYFADRGIFHPDYISGLILESYSKILNNESVNIDSMIKEYSSNEKEWMDE